MSGAEYLSNQQAINPYYTQGSIDVDQAKLEHEALVSLFESIGVRVVRIAPPNDSQDGVYTANWALVRGNKAVLARLPNARKSEEPYAQKTLQDLGKDVVTIPHDYKFSGQGDALACGNYLFCGQGYRSDEEAQKFAAEILGYTRIQLQTVPKLDEDGVASINQASGWPESYFYDLDMALSIIKVPSGDEKGLIAYCKDAFTPESQSIIESLENIEKIIVSQDEAVHSFACNLVSTGEQVVMSVGAPKLRADLEAHGLIVHTPEMTELAKGGGYIRCVTLSI